MDEQERFEDLLDTLAELREANRAAPIVVEGARDQASLLLLGMPGEIVTLHNGDPLFQVAERIASRTRDVILLTDWDAKGDRLFESLSSHLAACGARVDGRFRDKLRRGIRPTLNDVESLASYVGKHLARYQRRDLADLAD